MVEGLTSLHMLLLSYHHFLTSCSSWSSPSGSAILCFQPFLMWKTTCAWCQKLMLQQWQHMRSTQSFNHITLNLHNQGTLKIVAQHRPQQWAPCPFFFLEISLFSCYYSFGKVHISIFGSALLDPENSEQAMGNGEHQGWPQRGQQWALYWLGGSW